MTRISDALELLTAQHDELEQLVAELIAAHGDPRILVELADKLTTHLAAETELFYPSVVAVAPVEEHAELKAVVADLMLRPLDDPERDALVERLRLLVELHVAREDELFCAIAELMPTATLVGIGDQLQAWSDRSRCIAA